MGKIMRVGFGNNGKTQKTSIESEVTQCQGKELPQSPKMVFEMTMESGTLATFI